MFWMLKYFLEAVYVKTKLLKKISDYGVGISIFSILLYKTLYR